MVTTKCKHTNLASTLHILTPFHSNAKGRGLLTAANLQRLGDARDERLKYFREAKTVPDGGQQERERKVEKYVEEWEGKWKRAERG